MGRYKEMLQTAKKRGVTSEATMWKSIDQVDEVMETLKESHPDLYWHEMRKFHENMYGCHYDEEYAEYDIEQMHHTDKSGKKHTGAHWTKDEVVTAWQGKAFPAGTTDCDKWVAANSAYHDLSTEYNDGDVLKIAYMFYFADDDAPQGKVWKYMAAMRG